MKGLELAKKYYYEFGAPMIHNEFPELESIVAAGLAGSGSECFGYDDDISRDHDFEPGFCIFLPGEDLIDSRTAFILERAYARLPQKYGEFSRLKINPAGGGHHGVIRPGDFFRSKIGKESMLSTPYEWFAVPEHCIAEAVNGEIFRDDLGIMTNIRRALLEMPEDVMRKKLAGHLLLMSQSGQYNYLRCINHGETGAAQLAAYEFVNHTMAAAFLLNKRYMPYYKWRFRAFRELPFLGGICDSLEFLITEDNENTAAKTKHLMMEDIAAIVSKELRSNGLTRADCSDLDQAGMFSERRHL